MGIEIEPSWVEVSGVSTRYFDTGGPGDPMLLVTGGNFGSPEAASTVETWDRNIPALSERFRVIVIDKLGQGKTGNPLRDEDYTMQAVCRHIADFVRELDLRNIHMMGQSRGAMPVAASTMLFPERVKSCTLVNTSTLAPGIGLNEVVLSGCPYPNYSREAQRWNFERCAYDKSIVTDDFVEAGYEILSQEKYRESCRKMTTEGLKARYFVPELRKLKTELLRRIADVGLGRPAQIVWGVKDETATVDRALSLFDLIARHDPETQITFMNDAAHHPYREHPEHFHQIMFSFLDRVEARSAEPSRRAA
jgi:2-hydroxy-6-oxonona-2,4-dienedioate hydrolase